MKLVVAPLCQQKFVTILCNMETHVFRTQFDRHVPTLGGRQRFVTKIALKNIGQKNARPTQLKLFYSPYCFCN